MAVSSNWTYCVLEEPDGKVRIEMTMPPGVHKNPKALTVAGAGMPVLPTGTPMTQQELFALMAQLRGDGYEVDFRSM